VTRARGNRAPAWVAAYLSRWWPGAEKTPNSRPGADILGTPGVKFEIKTGVEWRSAWVRQAAGYAVGGELALIVYFPPGCGEASVGDALAVLPLREIMPLLVAAGYAPQPSEVT
jgi:hypothetical protein